MTVGELGRRMTSAELSEWLAYDRLHPLPDPWEQTGLLAALLANLLGSGRKKFAPEDFVPRRRRPKGRSRAAADLMRFEQFAAAMNAQAKKRGG